MGKWERGGIRRGKTECSRPFKIYYSLRECIFEILSIFFFLVDKEMCLMNFNFEHRSKNKV